MKFIDTNVFIRFLTADDPVKAAACRDLFQRVRRGDEEIATCEAVVTEIVYILSARGHYGLSPADVRARLRPMLMLRGLKLPHKRLYLRALDVFAAHPTLDFEDAVAVAHMERLKLTGLYSYDSDFDRVTGVTREEP
jgi:uncharacterized protein